ncbi:MAG: NUDIX domain-containing protein [Nanoarchaeota archaeon]|nr:NUDIX domain-containing protein [Nanoarchaeota archaeon]MBU1622189.1 NUDIX domain-containing protein [Nanoarchaeota archaeon]
MKIDLVVAGYIIHQNKVLLIHHRKLDLWLPVGGHIDENESPDQALLREIMEEVGVDVKILNYGDLPLGGNVKENMAIPFYTNVHSVGDHDHYCLFYLCKAINPEQLKINDEVKAYRWFTKEELNEDHILADVRNLCLKAFELFDNDSTHPN